MPAQEHGGHCCPALEQAHQHQLPLLRKGRAVKGRPAVLCGSLFAPNSPSEARGFANPHHDYTKHFVWRTLGNLIDNLSKSSHKWD